eukprot:7754320-Lingulodinium_polyedra.AAC.1
MRRGAPLGAPLGTQGGRALRACSPTRPLTRLRTRSPACRRPRQGRRAARKEVATWAPPARPGGPADP